MPNAGGANGQTISFASDTSTDTGSYFRDNDLRGVDLSGALFPPELSTEEIRLSVEHGTHVHYQ